MHCCIAHEMKCSEIYIVLKLKFNVIQYLLSMTVHLKLGKRLEPATLTLIIWTKNEFFCKKKAKGSTCYFSLFTFLKQAGSAGKEPTPPMQEMKEMRVQSQKGRSPGRGNDNPVQYSYLENLMD